MIGAARMSPPWERPVLVAEDLLVPHDKDRTGTSRSNVDRRFAPQRP